MLGPPLLLTFLVYAWLFFVFPVIVWISEVPDCSLFFSKKKVADNSLFFASHSCRAWFLYVCFPGAYKISAVMQGAPPDQMGASYPHMFLILLLLHGANAASKAPAGPKWQTLSGILFLFCFFCRYSFTYQGFQAFVLFYLPFQDSSSLMCNCSAMSPSC